MKEKSEVKLAEDVLKKYDKESDTWNIRALWLK